MFWCFFSWFQFISLYHTNTMFRSQGGNGLVRMTESYIWWSTRKRVRRVHRQLEYLNPETWEVVTSAYYYSYRDYLKLCAYLRGIENLPNLRGWLQLGRPRLCSGVAWTPLRHSLHRYLEKKSSQLSTDTHQNSTSNFDDFLFLPDI